MNTETQTVQGKYIFTDQELIEQGEKMTSLTNQKKEVEKELTQLKNQYKNKISGIEIQIESTLTAMENKSEMRPYNCTVFKNFDTGYTEYHDVISGNLIAKEALTAADYQMSMDDQLKKIEAEGAADQLGIVIEEKVNEADAAPSIFDEAVAQQEKDHPDDPLNLDVPATEPPAGVAPNNTPAQIPRDETFKPVEPVIEKPKRGGKKQTASDPDLEPNLRESDFSDPLTDGSRDDGEEDDAEFPW